MKRQKLTRWYPLGVLPVRDGVYELRHPHTTTLRFFSLWKNGRWHYPFYARKNGSEADEVKLAVWSAGQIPDHHLLHDAKCYSWRGLDAPP